MHACLLGQVQLLWWKLAILDDEGLMSIHRVHTHDACQLMAEQIVALCRCGSAACAMTAQVKDENMSG